MGITVHDDLLIQRLTRLVSDDLHAILRGNENIAGPIKKGPATVMILATSRLDGFAAT